MRTAGIGKSTAIGCLAIVSALLAAGAAQAQQTRIKFWHAMSGARYEAITKGIAEGFNKANPNYVLEPLYTGSYDETVTKAIAAVRAGDPPHIVQVFDVGTQTMLDSGAAIPVTELVKPGEINWEDYFPPIINYYTLAGKLHSMPFNSSTAILYYNKDAFKKAGLDPDKPPVTYNDIEEMGRRLLSSGATRAALTFGEAAWILEQTFAYHNQLYANNDNGRKGRATQALFNAPFGVEVLSRWKKWVDEKLLVYGGRAYAGNKAFLAGEVAMILQSTSQLTTLERGARSAVGTAFLPQIDGKPRGRSVVGGASLWALKGKGRSQQELDAIAKFFKFLSQPEYAAKWHQDTGYFPATRTAEKLLRDGGWFQQHPNHETAFKQIQLGPDTPATRGVLLGNFVQIRDITNTAVEKVLIGSLPPQAALDEAAREANKALDEYGRIHP